MMGPAVGRQDPLFHEFDLEERIPHDHLLRRIDAVLDLAGYGPISRRSTVTRDAPRSIQLMVRMLLLLDPLRAPAPS